MTEPNRAVAHYGYRRSPDQDARTPVQHPVIVVGAGPVGMSFALDLCSRGIDVVLLDDADRIGVGSRGICWSKRTLEIWDRLGPGERIVEKGVVWRKGKVFQGEALVYEFDLLPEGGHKMPAFINLQQYTLEQYLVDAVAARGRAASDRSAANREATIDLRWRNRITGIERKADGAVVSIDTPDGVYRLGCDWLVCCDGARSPCRAMLGLEFAGRAFSDQFLIADVRMTASFPTERWLWFDPPFHPGESALLHKQPEDVWRIDLQLGPEADAQLERQSERVIPRIERMLGHKSFEIVWTSIYTFNCRRMVRFQHGHVLFAGDAAHQVSPFGARGANSGVQDAENLAWKLAAVLRGDAPEELLATYDIERGQAADENIRHSSGATDFIAPVTATERVFRNAALDLAATAPFARGFVNAGRLSTATVYDSPLSTPDVNPFGGVARLGAPMPDAPVFSGGETRWLLNVLGGSGPTVLAWNADAPEIAGVRMLRVGRDIADREGLLTTRLDARPGSTYVIRSDQHLAARRRSFDVGWIEAAVARMMGR